MSSRASSAGGFGQRLVDGLARRPGGVIGRLAYRNGPKAHEPSFEAVWQALQPIGEQERVLEIGCGPGVLLERVLAAGVARAAGLDHSADMLALCIARNQRAVADERLRLKLGDAAAIPWRDDTFTAAISANMFFFVYDPSRVLTEIHRVLAPGGRLVIASMSGPLPAPSLRHWWLYPPMGPALNVHTDEQMHGLLTDAGFIDIHVESEQGQLALQLARASKKLSQYFCGEGLSVWERIFSVGHNSRGEEVLVAAASVWRVRDELWEAVRPLLPECRPDPRGGRPRVDDRVCFNAIVFVLFTGIAWRHLPSELGCSPATAHRRLAEWQAAGVWERLHRQLLRRLNAAGRIDWSAAVVDGSHIRALLGGFTPAPRRSIVPATAQSTI